MVLWLRPWQEMRGLPSCSSFFLVKQALKGYRRSTFVPDDRRPIGLSLLRRLCDATLGVCFSGYEALLFKVTFVLFYFGAFRVSDLLPGSKLSSLGLWSEHVLVDHGRVQVFLRRSKTDQLGRGEWVTVSAWSDASVFSVALVTGFLATRPAEATHFLSHWDQSPLTRY